MVRPTPCTQTNWLEECEKLTANTHTSHVKQDYLQAVLNEYTGEAVYGGHVEVQA